MTAEPTSLDFRNTNTLWCSVLVETLRRCGVSTAVISPGSRSTPITMALARQPAIEVIPVLDERSAAFLALGLAKQQHRPVVLVCTSGTAGANYFPALIEARESRVPLLVITADRPPELRECASGQTIDQQKLFGGHVNWFHELCVPEPRLELLRYLRQTIAQAVARTLAPAAGPVHLNAPFRDPLVPVENDSAKALASQIDSGFFDHVGAALPASTNSVIWQRPTTARGLIVAGPAAPADAAGYAAKVLALAEGLGWPVLADVLSPLRHYAEPAAAVVTTYDAILRESSAAQALTPRYVLCLGGWPTSKVLRAWLEQSQAEVLLVSPDAGNRDALHGRTRHLVAPVEALAAAGKPMPDPSYVTLWQKAETTARAAFDTMLGGDELRVFEGKAAWLLARHLPEDTPLFVANSMPVRDVEYFWPATTRKLQVHFSRGANGIDGTLSTALGLAHGNAPTVLLTGDLALLHDTNGFLHRPKLRGSLTIVLINNRGGGIFEHLPVAQFNPPFEELWATPQDVDFARLCGAYGVEHVLVGNWDDFTRLITTLPTSGVRVLEVRTDRKRDAALRKKLFADVAKQAGQALRA